MTDTPTKAEIKATLKRLDHAGQESGLCADAAKCIRWLQAGVGAAELDCETKRGAIDALTEGRGLPDDDLWAALKRERDDLRKIVAKLPKTADGVPIVPGMHLYPLHPLPEVDLDGTEDYAVVEMHATDPFGGDDIEPEDLSKNYSSREAAERGREAGVTNG